MAAGESFVVALWEFVFGKFLHLAVKRGITIWKPIRFPHTSRNLQALLKNRYSSTTFHIVSDRQAFDRAIVRVLLRTLRARHRAGSGNDPVEPPIRVGIVCGPMVFRV